MCYCNGWLPPLAVPYLMQCSPLVVAASLPVFWELMQTNMTVRAAILDIALGTSGVCTFGILHLHYCRIWFHVL